VKLQISRFIDNSSYIQEFELAQNNISLLEALKYIKSNIDASLSFESSCRSGVCGSCALRVNSREVLACSYKVQDGDVIEPLKLKNYMVLKDLIIIPNRLNQNKIKDLNLTQNRYIKHQDFKQVAKATECIGCSSCLSSCPVYEYDGEFLAPFLQVKSLRYIDSSAEIISNIQTKAIWDCTMCGNCNMVCPAHIDIKGDIMKLRTKSIQSGFSDPNMANSSFNMDFGFNPNF